MNAEETYQYTCINANIKQSKKPVISNREFSIVVVEINCLPVLHEYGSFQQWILK